MFKRKLMRKGMAWRQRTEHKRQRDEQEKRLNDEIARCAEWTEGPDHQHGKAGRLCLFCRKFRFETAEPDWSEATPGRDLWIACGWDEWVVDNFEDTAETYRAKLMTAVSCELFDPIDYWKEAING